MPQTIRWPLITIMNKVKNILSGSLGVSLYYIDVKLRKVQETEGNIIIEGTYTQLLLSGKFRIELGQADLGLVSLDIT